MLAAGSAGCGGVGSPAGANAAIDTPPGRASLDCLLTAPQAVRLAEPLVPLGFTLRNEGFGAITVLRRQTPLEGILGDLFDVTLEGARRQYRGRMVKRGPPGAHEYVTIAPGSHAHATVDLAEGYDLSSLGRYRVRFARRDEFACNELTIERY